jgi:hypothetical protein
MKTIQWMSAGLLAAGLLVACGKEETPSAPSPPPAAPAAGVTPATPAAPAAPTVPAAPATADVTAKAQTLIDQANGYIADHKLDLADKAVTQLEALKPNLPTDWQSKVDTLRKALDAAKAANGMSIPKIGG